MSYLKLIQLQQTTFEHEGQLFNVATCPAPVFDAFMLLVFETIEDIDRQKWDIYARWDAINDALAHGDLLLPRSKDGTFLLGLPEVQAEEKTTVPEEKLTECPEVVLASAQKD